MIFVEERMTLEGAGARLLPSSLRAPFRGRLRLSWQGLPSRFKNWKEGEVKEKLQRDGATKKQTNRAGTAGNKQLHRPDVVVGGCLSGSDVGDLVGWNT